MNNSGGAGIGGNNNGDGGSITISGGTIKATGGYAAAGIGGGCNGDGTGTDGSIIIRGGIVTATGSHGAAGIGGGYSGDAGTFTTGENGTAFIVASSIADTSYLEDITTSGVIITPNDGDAGNGYIYGDTYTLSANATIPSGYTLTVESGKYFTVPSGVVFTVAENGTFETLEDSTVYTNQIMAAGTYPMTVVEDSVTEGDTTESTTTTTSTATVTTWYVVTLSTSGGGTLAPELSEFALVTMQEGTSYTFSITPSSGYAISAVYVDGTNIGAVTSYTIDCINSDRSIHVDFVSTSASSTSADTQVEETTEDPADDATADQTPSDDATTDDSAADETTDDAEAAESATVAQPENSNSAAPVVAGVVAGVTALSGAGYGLFKRKVGFGSKD